MSSDDNELFIGKRLNATISLKPNGQPVKLGGIFCTTSGSITIYNGVDATGELVVPTFNAVAGNPYPFPLNLNLGCYIVVSGFDGTVMFI